MAAISLVFFVEGVGGDLFYSSSNNCKADLTA